MLTNNDLLDISNAKELTGDELAFYEDQKKSRVTRLREEIDVEYAEEIHLHEVEEEKRREADNIEDFVNPAESQEVLSKTPVRSQRKRLADSTPEAEHAEKLTDIVTPETPHIPSQPRIRKVRNVEFKDAIATVSYRTAVSVSKARVAVQAVCDKIYNHNYYLSVEEKEKIEGNEHRELRHKKPRTKEDYEKNYQFVLPSAKVVSSYKHEKALHQEIAAAKALVSIQPDTRCTLHFDTTGQSRVQGEWAALILNFLSDDKAKCQMFRL